MILGGSGFIGQGLYKELHSFYNVHCTYHQAHPEFDRNRQFHQWDMEREPLSYLLENLRPHIIISALRGDFNAQISVHHEIIAYLRKNDCKLVFLSSANVFDAFTNFPSYEYDKTLSMSIYGKFKIQIENALLRLPDEKYNICRLPMVFGAGSPRIDELKTQYQHQESIEVFPGVVINVTIRSKLSRQIHFILNHNLTGVFHLGSTDLIHHNDLILEICEKLSFVNPRITQVFESNDDRFLAILPKDNLLPEYLQVTTRETIEDSVITP